MIEDYPPLTSRLTVVIPSNRPEIRTASSVPDGIPVHVERDGTLNEARNRGVQRADTPYVCIMDDDLAFPESVLEDLYAMVDHDTLVGLADWDYGWIAGRTMLFHQDLWERAGGFDERLGSHMGDTKFALDVLAAGGRLERVPREVVHHEPHERSVSAWDHAWRGLYLALQHPRHAPRLFTGMVIS